MSATVRLVCFDLGGVLVRICRSWEEGCRAAGLDLRAERDPARLHERLELLHGLDTGRVTPDAFYAGISATMANAYSPDEIRRIHGAWILGEYEGVAAVVTRLHDAGVETACLSNTNHDHWEYMLAGSFPAMRALRHKHASHVLGLRKPDDAIYGAFEERTGRRAGEIAFFDDLEENVAAASARGWRAHHVDHTGDTASQIARAVRELGIHIE